MIRVPAPQPDSLVGIDRVVERLDSIERRIGELADRSESTTIVHTRAAPTTAARRRSIEKQRAARITNDSAAVKKILSIERSLERARWAER